MILDNEAVLNSLRAAVEKYSPDHVAMCHYVYPDEYGHDKPMCIVGVALEPLIGIEAVTYLEHGNPDPYSLDKYGFGAFIEYETYENANERFEDLTGHSLTEDAYTLLATAQYEQDDGKVWGYALSEVESVASQED